MSLSRKILGLAALIGVVGLATGTSAEAADASKKKNQFAAFMSLPSGIISAQNAAGMITTQSTSSATQVTPMRAARNIAASATNPANPFTPFERRRFQILQRQYVQLITLLGRAQLSQERGLLRQLSFGVITPTQFSTNLQGVVALYQLARNDATTKFLAAATASR